MKTLPLYILSVLLLFSLVAKSQTHAAKPMGSISIAVKKQVSAIANYIDKHNDQLMLFAKLPGKKIPVRVKNAKWPDDVDYSYNVLKDSTGKVIFIVQMPFSESGDWYIEYRHYFDSNGNTIAFERITNVFDSDVKGGVIYEILNNFYSSGLKLVDKTYTLTQKNGKSIKNNGHVNMYHYPYQVYKNADECLKAYNIKL